MAENETPAVPPDPYPGVPATEAAAPVAAPKSPWAASKPIEPVKDPAVRMEPPPDPGSPFSRGLPGNGGDAGTGPSEMMLAGMGRIMEQQKQILEMLKGGARF